MEQKTRSLGGGYKKGAICRSPVKGLESRPGVPLHEDRVLDAAEVDVEVHCRHCAAVGDAYTKMYACVSELLLHFQVDSAHGDHVDSEHDTVKHSPALRMRPPRLVVRFYSFWKATSSSRQNAK